MADKITVDMWNWNFGSNAVVITPSPTGIVYTNQTHGMMCYHPEIEGYISDTFSISDIPTCQGCQGCLAPQELIEEIEWRLHAKVETKDEAWITLDDGRIVTTANCD